jgi:hypothetical protein
VDPYAQRSWRNVKSLKFNPRNFLNAAIAGIDDGHIAADRFGRSTTPMPWRARRGIRAPRTSTGRASFSKPTRSPIWPRAIKLKYQRVPAADALEATVARFNGFVDAGKDDDFDRPKPLYKIPNGPFYAAWATRCCMTRGQAFGLTQHVR